MSIDMKKTPTRWLKGPPKKLWRIVKPEHVVVVLNVVLVQKYVQLFQLK